MIYFNSAQFTGLYVQPRSFASLGHLWANPNHAQIEIRLRILIHIIFFCIFWVQEVCNTGDTLNPLGNYPG